MQEHKSAEHCFNHSFKGRGGLRLQGDIVGKGPPVVLLHGGGQTRASWKETAQTLAGSGYQAITYDARGHGDSDWATEGYDFGYFADDLLEILHEVGGRPALVGASLGGLTSLLAVGNTSTPIASAIVLVDITPTMNPKGTEEVGAFMRSNPEGFASVEEAADAVSLYMKDRPRPRDVSGLRRNLRERGGRLYWHWDPDFMNPPGGHFDRHQFEARFIDAARRVHIPALMVRGGHSHIVSEEQVDFLKEVIPHCAIAEIPKAGHMVAGDANTSFAAALIPWLEKVYPPA